MRPHSINCLNNRSFNLLFFLYFPYQIQFELSLVNYTKVELVSILNIIMYPRNNFFIGSVKYECDMERKSTFWIDVQELLWLLDDNSKSHFSNGTKMKRLQILFFSKSVINIASVTVIVHLTKLKLFNIDYTAEYNSCCSS